MIFLLNTRFQIAAMLFFIVIVYDFFRNLKLPLRSNKVFAVMLFFSGLYLIFDIICVYARTHMELVSPLFLRSAHQLFNGTLMIIIMLLYLYTQILAHSQRRLTRGRLIFTLTPLGLMLIVVIFGPIDYYLDATSTYSTGLVSYVAYFCVFFYIILSIIQVLTAGDEIRQKQKTAIITGTFIWIIAAIIQFFNHNILTSGMAVILMMLFIYLSFENPKEHYDQETGTLNKRAFHLMLNDQYDLDKPLLITSIVIDNLLRLQSTIGHSNANALMEIIGLKLQTIFLSFVYHSRGNVLTLILDRPLGSIENQLLELEDFMDQMFRIAQFNVLTNYHIDIINTEKVKESTDEILELMNYMSRHHQLIQGQRIYILDEKILELKQRYTMIDRLLHQAIDNNGFYVVYQPIYDVKIRGFRSAEALVRLSDTETIGYVSPEEFIVIAESRGLIMDLGRIVFEKVCAFSAANRLFEGELDYIEVNLSGIQCVHPDLPQQLADIMKAYQIPPSFLNLEITETASVESGEMLERNMIALRNLGCSFSMDDFGTGYSNLSQMSEVVYDLVKIDKSLIWPCFLESNDKSMAILKNMINMLLELKVKIVAEGIETREMCDFLTEQRINYLQGYYFSRPIPEDEFLLFIRRPSALN